VARQRSPLVFLSYSSKDRKFAERLTADLRASAVSVWFDSDEVTIGDSIVDRLASGLAQCTHLLLIISKHYVASSWCKAELRATLHRAIKSGKATILPILVSTPPESIWDEPPFLFVEDLRRLDLSPASYRQNLPELLRALSVEVPAAPAATVEESLTSTIRHFVRAENLEALHFREHGIMHVLNCESLPMPQAEIGDPSLTFVTEEHIHFLNYECGLSLNFSLRNSLDDEITVHSLEPEVVSFLGTESAEFQAVIKRLPRPSMGGSAPIFTHALFVRLSSDPFKCLSGFGQTEDSAGARGIISPFNRFRDVDASEQARFARPIERVQKLAHVSSADPLTMTKNSIPATIRFLLKAGESDAFHCQIVGDEAGIFFFRFKVGFHYGDVKAVRFSDEIYPCFAGIGYSSEYVKKMR